MGLINNIKNALFGSDSTPHVQTTFSNNQENVMNLLNETLTNIESSIESNTTASNNVGKVNIVATKGSKIKIDLTQTANVQAAQVYMSMIDLLMKSDANTDTKLDALGNVCQAVKNDGTILQSPETAAANIQLSQRNESNLSNIQKLNQDLKIAVSTCAVNNFEGGNFLADEDSEIEFKLNQKAEAISDSLTKMITSEKSTLSDEEKQEMKSEIEADNKAEGTGIIAGISHEVGSSVRNISDNVAGTVQKISDDTSSSFKTMIIAGVAGVVGLIILIVLIIVGVVIFKKMTIENEKNGGYYDDYDYDNYDEL